MNAWAIIEKGLNILPSLIAAGASVYGVITKMKVVAEKSKNGEKVERSELEELEADLDGLLMEFNSPLPPE